MNKTFYEKTPDFNFITRFLHTRKNKILFKYLNKFDKDKKISILDIGCGPAFIFPELLNFSKNIDYTGIDVRKDFIDEANNRYSSYKQFKALQMDCKNYLDKISNVDIIISFDCFEHIPLDTRNKVIDLISKINFKLMLVNVPNEIGPAILFKNLGSYIMGYIRYKEYTIKETISSFFYRIDNFEAHYDGHKGFDWRMLNYTLRFFFFVKVYTSPFIFFPKFLSPTIFFVCNKKNIISYNEKIINNAKIINEKYGFDLNVAKTALEKNTNNMELALNYLKSKK